VELQRETDCVYVDNYSPRSTWVEGKKPKKREESWKIMHTVKGQLRIKKTKQKKTS